MTQRDTAPIVVAHSYFLRRDPKEWEAMKPYPPLGTLWAASCLRSQGHTVALFDAMLESGPETFVSTLERLKPQRVVLFEDNFNYVTKMCLLQHRESALAMVRNAKTQGCSVICAGADAGDHAEIFIEAGADYVITGEGELTLMELFDHFATYPKKEPYGIAGLVFRDGAGRTNIQPARPVLRDLDCLPPPAWDLVDMDRYRRAWMTRHGYFSLNLATTRGCPYKCNWCAKPIYGNRYNSRSPANVVDEIHYLVCTHKPDHLWITDDIFGLKPGWIRDFSRRMLSRRLCIPFKCLSRADLLTTEVVEDLKQAGCSSVWIGAESGSQKILDAMEKGVRVDEIRAATAALKKVGIEVGFFLQFGYPGESIKEIRATRTLIRECRPDDIGISVSYPLPGTPFYERVKAQLGAKHNWTESADLDMLYRGPYPREFYRSLHRFVHAEFRIRRILDRLAARQREWRQVLNLARHGVRWLVAGVQMMVASRRGI